MKIKHNALSTLPPFFNNRTIKLFIALLSGIGLFLISPPSGISFFAWFAYAPIIYISSQSRYLESATYGFIFSFVGNFLIFNWLIATIDTFSDITFFYAVLIVLLYSLVLALPLTLFSLSIRYFWKNLNRYWIIIVPAAFVIIEYFSAYISLFPYQHGMSQFENLIILQISSITGNWGVSFLILLVNTYITAQFICYKQHKPYLPKIYTVSIFIIISFVLVFGSLTVDSIDEKVKAMPTVSVLQLQDKVSSSEWVKQKKDKRLKRKLESYWYQQTKANQDKVDWIIWPESSVSLNIEAKYHRLNLSNLAKQKNSFISLGGIGQTVDKHGNKQSFNSIFNFSNNGNYLGRYDKQILVPFSEYTPFSTYFGITPLVSNLSKGNQVNTFMIGKAKVAFPICYEAIFQSTYHNFSDADLITNLSNDIWFVNSRGRELHAMISQIRAIEFGVPVLRLGYTGLSFYVKANGKRMFELPPDSKQQRVINVPYGKIPTFYSRWGDWFVVLCGLVVFISLLINKRKYS